jgi:hypothetical protein
MPQSPAQEKPKAAGGGGCGGGGKHNQAKTFLAANGGGGGGGGGAASDKRKECDFECGGGKRQATGGLPLTQGALWPGERSCLEWVQSVRTSAALENCQRIVEVFKKMQIDSIEDFEDLAFTEVQSGDPYNKLPLCAFKALQKAALAALAAE